MKELASPIVIFSIAGFIFQIILIYIFYSGSKRLEKRAESYFKDKEKSSESEREKEIKKVLMKEHQKKIQELEGKFREKQIQTSSLFIKIKNITSTLDSVKIIKQLTDILKKDLNVLRAIIFLKDEKGFLFPVETLGEDISNEEMGIKIPIEEKNYLSLSMKKQNILSVNSFQQDPELANIKIDNPLVKCKIAVPLVAENESIAVIAIKDIARELEVDDMRLLSAISSLVGMTLHNASDFESSKRLSEKQLKEKKQLEKIFSKYVSGAVVEQLLENPEMQVLGGKKQKITIMFCDIRGFTSMSENMEPEEVVELLNVYFSEMSELILKYNGTLDKFMGDAIMALYGAPIQNRDDALMAITTAIEMQKSIDKLNQQRKLENKSTIKMGIGLNSGECIIGNIGSEQRLEYTAIGDSVNIASRLCSVAKGGQILVSESTFLEIAEMVNSKKLEPIMVKGKSEPIPIFQINGLV